MTDSTPRGETGITPGPEPDLPWKLAYGHFTRLRAEPRYQALLRRMGLTAHSGRR